MTTPMTTQHQSISFARDLLYAARYYLWRPRVLLAIAAAAIAAGLVFNWSWLVAVGLAPILISTLPCLVMCAFGVCMMCRSGDKHSASIRDVADAPSRSAGFAVSAIGKPSMGIGSPTSAPQSIEAAMPPQPPETNPFVTISGCCQASANEVKLEQTINLEPNQERRGLHA